MSKLLKAWVCFVVVVIAVYGVIVALYDALTVDETREQPVESTTPKEFTLFRIRLNSEYSFVPFEPTLHIGVHDFPYEHMWNESGYVHFGEVKLWYSYRDVDTIDLFADESDRKIFMIVWEKVLSTAEVYAEAEIIIAQLEKKFGVTLPKADTPNDMWVCMLDDITSLGVHVGTPSRGAEVGKKSVKIIMQNEDAFRRINYRMQHKDENERKRKEKEWFNAL